MIIKLKPIFKEKIWGGKRLKEVFDYNIPSDKTGEAWVVSGHKNGSSIVDGGIYDGWTLSKLYSEHRELFGNIKNPEFPILVKYIDASDKLSVQVHPDDSYASKYNSAGKTECWYVVDCDKDADIVIGHNAETKEELISMVKENNYDSLLKSRKISKGDFFYITPGTIHAICENTLILEIQQSSDITFRLYDYDRLENGKLRDLHTTESIDVVSIPHIDNSIENCNEGLLLDSEFFKVHKYIIKCDFVYKCNDTFSIVNIISGEGFVNDKPLTKGDSFIITSEEKEILFSGNMVLFISEI